MIWWQLYEIFTAFVVVPCPLPINQTAGNMKQNQAKRCCVERICQREKWFAHEISYSYVYLRDELQKKYEKYCPVNLVTYICTLQLCITRKFLSYGLPPPLEVGFLYLFCMPIVQAAKASFMIISCIVLHRKVPDFGFCCGSKLLLLALLVGDRIFHNVMTALGPSVNKIYILRQYTRVHTK